jgi:hypothetical protein
MNQARSAAAIGPPHESPDGSAILVAVEPQDTTHDDARENHRHSGKERKSRDSSRQVSGIYCWTARVFRLAVHQLAGRDIGCRNAVRSAHPGSSCPRPGRDHQHSHASLSSRHRPPPPGRYLGSPLAGDGNVHPPCALESAEDIGEAPLPSVPSPRAMAVRAECHSVRRFSQPG